MMDECRFVISERQLLGPYTVRRATSGSYVFLQQQWIMIDDATRREHAQQSISIHRYTYVIDVTYIIEVLKIKKYNIKHWLGMYIV